MTQIPCKHYIYVHATLHTITNYAKVTYHRANYNKGGACVGGGVGGLMKQNKIVPHNLEFERCGIARNCNQELIRSYMAHIHGSMLFTIQQHVGCD